MYDHIVMVSVDFSCVEVPNKTVKQYRVCSTHETWRFKAIPQSVRTDIVFKLTRLTNDSPFVVYFHGGDEFEKHVVMYKCDVDLDEFYNTMMIQTTIQSFSSHTDVLTGIPVRKLGTNRRCVGVVKNLLGGIFMFISLTLFTEYWGTVERIMD